jgi:sodium/hydrogen antiporter
MPTLVLTNFNIITAVLGGFITVFGLVSYLFKERFYLSEACKLLDPSPVTRLGSEENLAYITLYFSRLVLGVQLVLAGVQLPSRYLQREWKSLAILLGPNMVVMWMCASLLIFAMVPNLPILHALACGACVTPTDPVLSNSIVKGKFADKNIPKDLQKIIIAESGANDGLGYPFLFLALYVIKYSGDGGLGQRGGTAKAMGYWFGETWAYTILLSVVYGITVGWIAKELLHFAENRKFVDRESFLVFAITLALFITGTCGMIGSDDVLACFVAGNVFTWDDWFRLETLDDSLQPTIDMLLNLSIFIWYGAVCPWVSFRVNDVIPLYRLIFLGILILLFRRIPSILIMHKRVWQIEHFRQALFVGFFGPIGVSAIFYLYVSIDFLDQITVDGEVREDAAKLKDVMTVVIWFLAICSIVVHGLSIPIGKLGYQIPRTISSALSSSMENSEPQNIHLSGYLASTPQQAGLRQRRNPQDPPPRQAFKLGGIGLSSRNSDVHSPISEPSRPIDFGSSPHTQQNSPRESPNLSNQSFGDGRRAVVADEERRERISGGTVNEERD